MAQNQIETVKIVIDVEIDQGVVSNPNVLFNSAQTYCQTTIQGLSSGIKVLSAKYHGTVYPKPGETTFVPSGLGNS